MEVKASGGEDNKYFTKSGKERGNPDWIIFALIAGLVLFGIVMVYSASYYSAEAEYGDAFFFVKKQAVGAVLGFAAMTGFMFLDYNKLKRFALPALAAAFILLALVFVPGIGIENYGAKRWIKLPGMSFQPSEFAKFAFVLFAAAYMSARPERMRTLRGLLPVLGAGAAMCVLIILEPNLSITVCVGLTMLVTLFIGGAKFKHFTLIFIPMAAAVPVLIIIEPYRLNRLAAFLNPWASPLKEGYQLIQSLYALGSGGLFGTGLFNGRQKYNFLPFAESDFIFSIIGEELGLIGCIILTAVYLTVIIRGVKTALRAPDRFAAYLAAGISSVIAIQLLINIAVVTGSIPPTGLPLPFLSAGGSSLVVFMSASGVLLNISRTCRD